MPMTMKAKQKKRKKKPNCQVKMASLLPLKLISSEACVCQAQWKGSNDNERKVQCEAYKPVCHNTCPNGSSNGLAAESLPTCLYYEKINENERREAVCDVNLMTVSHYLCVPVEEWLT